MTSRFQSNRIDGVISNFEYDANKKYLHFEFDGELIKEDFASFRQE
jgi:hypothetical protein